MKGESGGRRRGMRRNEEKEEAAEEEECEADDVTAQDVFFLQLSVFSLDRWMDFCFY